VSALRALTTRDRVVLVVVLVAAAIIGTWLLVIQPKRSEASKLGSQLNVAQTQLQTAQQQVQAGLAAKSAFASSYTEIARLGQAVPADDNVPSMILQLQNAAVSDHVDFRTLNISAGSSGSSTAAVTASTAQAVTASLPPGATVGSAGFPIESFTFTFRGNFFHLSSFLGRVQRFVITRNNRVTVSGRLLSFNAISLGAGPAGFPQITATIAATAYLVPASQGVMAGATASGPSTGSSGSTSETASTASSGSTPAAVATSPIR
jgi:type II secretory pathway pseudopilin PulG